jgi:hypothetical protein
VKLVAADAIYVTQYIRTVHKVATTGLSRLSFFYGPKQVSIKNVPGEELLLSLFLVKVLQDSLEMRDVYFVFHAKISFSRSMLKQFYPFRYTVPIWGGPG